MKRTRFHNGYTFLLSVLFVGAIAMAVTGTMVLLSWLTMRTSATIESSTQAFELAMTCAEQGLLSLFKDGGYGGYEEFSTGDGICDILPIGGAGNENRTLCVEGTKDGVTRRLEIVVQKVLPAIRILSWQEVDMFAFCTYN